MVSMTERLMAISMDKPMDLTMAVLKVKLMDHQKAPTKVQTKGSKTDQLMAHKKV